MDKSYRQYMISIIRAHWHYNEGVLESMTDAQVKEIFEQLIDWLH